VKSLANIGLAMQNICLRTLGLYLRSYIIGGFNKEKARKFSIRKELEKKCL